MSIRFLLFRGNWENEGNFYLLETDDSIIVLSTGKDFSLSYSKQEQQIGQDYLKEKREKIKAIIISNTNFRNINFLKDICDSLGNEIPIFSSFHSKIIINSIFPGIRNKINVVGKNKDISVGGIKVNFFPLNSYLIGNLALKISYVNQVFFFVEGFVSTNLLDNNLLFPDSLSFEFKKFFTSEEGSSKYLVISCQSIHWRDSNSLFFASNLLPSPQKKLFFILYEFDWLHILELFELVRRWGKKLVIVDKIFLSLIKKVLRNNNHLLSIIRSNPIEIMESDVRLMVGNPDNLKRKIEIHIDNSEEKDYSETNFIVCVPPIIGGESSLARLVDYLHDKSEIVVNLSKKEYLKLGTNFYDFKTILKMIKPERIITFQNSYKNSKFFDYLPSRKVMFIDNGYSLNFPTKQLSRLRIKKSLISLDELLVKQRKDLGKFGLITLIIMISWDGNVLLLKKVVVEPLAVSSDLNKEKLESKIHSWWDSKIVRGLDRSDDMKIIKKTIEKRLGEKICIYLSQEHDIEIEEPLILIFNQKRIIKKQENKPNESRKST